MSANAFTAYPYTDANITKAFGVQRGVAKLLGIFTETDPGSITSIRIGSAAGAYLLVTLDDAMDNVLDQADLDEFLANLFPSAHSIVANYGTNPTITVRGDATPDWTAALAGTPLTNGADVTEPATAPSGTASVLWDNSGTTGSLVSDYDTFAIDPGVTIGTNHRRDVVYDPADYDPSLASAQDELTGMPTFWVHKRDLYANMGAQGYPGGVEAP